MYILHAANWLIVKLTEGQSGTGMLCINHVPRFLSLPWESTLVTAAQFAWTFLFNLVVNETFCYCYDWRFFLVGSINLLTKNTIRKLHAYMNKFSFSKEAVVMTKKLKDFIYFLVMYIVWQYNFTLKSCLKIFYYRCLFIFGRYLYIVGPHQPVAALFLTYLSKKSTVPPESIYPLGRGKTLSLLRCSPYIFLIGTTFSTLSWMDMTQLHGVADAVYCGEETVEANFFGKNVLPYRLSFFTDKMWQYVPVVKCTCMPAFTKYPKRIVLIYLV